MWLTIWVARVDDSSNGHENTVGTAIELNSDMLQRERRLGWKVARLERGPTTLAAPFSFYDRKIMFHAKLDGPTLRGRLLPGSELAFCIGLLALL